MTCLRELNTRKGGDAAFATQRSTEGAPADLAIMYTTRQCRTSRVCFDPTQPAACHKLSDKTVFSMFVFSTPDCGNFLRQFSWQN